MRVVDGVVLSHSIHLYQHTKTPHPTHQVLVVLGEELLAGVHELEAHELEALALLFGVE